MSNVFVFRRPPHGVITEYFGGGKGGSTTTTNNVTQIPPEVLARYNAVNARADTVAQQPYQAYSQDPNAFVAPLNDTQQAGIQNTNIMAGAAQPYYGAATDQLIQAQAGAQPGINAAYQNVGQAQNVGNQYANTAAQQYDAAQNIGSQYAGAAGQQYAGAQGAAAPYYQAATQGLGAGLNYANPLNQAAAQAAGGAFGAAAPYYQAATQGTQQALQGAQPYQGLATAAALSGAQGVDPGALQTQQYMNPYTQNVVQATQAALNQQQGQQLAQQQADAIMGGAFGSGRAASQRAQLQGQQSLAQSQAISPLLQQNYQQALAAAQQQQGVGLGAAQANRAAIQQAGQQLGALGQQTYGQQLGAANQMANLGQNLYGQGITGAQTLSQLGQTGYGQQLSASQQAQALGQGLYGQAIGTGQALQGLGQQQYGQGLGTGQAQAALGQQQYGQGQATAQQLAALAQQGYGMGAGTSAALAGLGTSAQQAGLAGAQAQLAAGQTQQQTQQAGLQALYNQFQQQQGFPYQQAQFLANIAEGTGALSGNATSGTSTTTGGGGFFSDERLKENVQKVGKTNDGQPIYRYNYKGDKNTQIGLLAQDVEKKHPEAVGLAGGYKTVNYKKATEDAVHKADGGAAGDAYSMGAPSQMLQENSGKGLGAVPALPQMITGPQRIEAGANAADVAAMRSPAVTGFAPGVSEGKQAELASLQSTLANPGPNANQLGSGPDYLQNRIGTLQDWLSKNNSQGGLVSQPGNFAQGGLAGGYADGGYMNPALAYYSPQQAQQGVFQLQPAGQYQILHGNQMQAPQQRQQPDAVTSALNMAKLVQTGNDAYKARPDFLRSAADVAARQQTENAQKAIELQKIQWAKDNGYNLNPTAATPASDAPATAPDMGSLADAPVPMPRPEGTALGSAAGDSVGTGAAVDAATAPTGGVIDLTTVAPGLGAATADTAATGAGLAGAAPEAIAAAAPEAAAGLGAAAGVGEAAAAAAPAIPAWLAILGAPLGFENGGVVPRKKFADGGSEDGTDTTDEPSTGLLPTGFGDAAEKTLSSSDFWVPAVAGLGAMLASPNKRFLGAVGSGLVGGAEAYKGQQQLALNQQKNALETAKYMATSFTKFVDPDTQEIKWRGPNGVISDAQHNALLGQAATTFGQSGLSGAASNVAGVLKGAPKPSAPQINVPVVNKELETTTVPGGTPAATAVETAKNVVPIAAPIPTQRSAPNVKEALASTSPAVAPPPAAAAPAATASPMAVGESQIANPNDRPTELKARVGNLTQAIAKSQSEGVAATDLITQRQQLQERADDIINGTVIPLDKDGNPVTTFKDAANQRAQDASLTDAIGKNKGDYYKNASAFLENYPQDKQLIKSMATVFRSINMNRATGDMADAVGYLRSIPGLSALIPESLATMQGGYDEATKNGVMQAFAQMASAQGEKAPKSIMSEALQTIATPSKAPEARMALLAQKSGQMDRQNDMYSDWIAANKPDPAQFAISWNNDPAHNPEKYIEKAQKEIGVFKGAAPLAGNPPLPGQGSKSISQVGEPSQVNAQALRDYSAKYPSKKADAITTFDKMYYPGAANKILGVQ